MNRQRNTEQMKEKTRNTEVQINEKEIGRLPEKEFRIMIIKLINLILKKIFFFLIFWLHHAACGILVLQPGTEPMPPALAA